MNIEWAYLRKGWASCKKAQEFLEQHNITIVEVLDARKNKLDAGRAWEKVENATSLTVAKGKKILEFNEIADKHDDVLKNIMGPSGNLRAPTLKIGNSYVVGFNLELYTKSFG